MKSPNFNTISNNPKVVVIIDIPWAYERELLSGISLYNRNHRSWAIYVQVLADKRLSSKLEIKNADGLIALSSDLSKNKDYLRPGLPSILFNEEDEDIGNVPIIKGNETAIGQLGASYFLERRFKHFAFFGYSNLKWSMKRYEGFQDTLKDYGYKAMFYNTSKPSSGKTLENERMKVAKQLGPLPKPLAVMACDDINSLNIVESCKLVNLQIPEDVAVLGVDNDSLLCNLSYPPLSSVVMANQVAGYSAARLLDQIIKGEQRMSNQIITIQPSHISTRMSTDILSVKDPMVQQAIKVIRGNSYDTIQTSEVADILGVSRQLLHNRFRKVLGCTVHDEIKKVRIERISLMLIETDMTIENIALKMGYCSAKHLSRYFKQAKGINPLEYRKKFSKSFEV